MPRICSKHQHYDPNCEICQSDIEFPEPSQDDKQEAVMCIVMRKAVLQEDEGREHFVESFPDRQSAQDWIDAQKGQYFRPSDYYITGC